MAATVTHPASSSHRPGRRADRLYNTNPNTVHVSSPLGTSINTFRDTTSASGNSYSTRQDFPASYSASCRDVARKPHPPALDTSVAHSTTTRLHKRMNSVSSSHGPPSPLSASITHFATPFATYEEASLNVSPSATPLSGTPKLKPYLRKMSLGKEPKEDQGRIDLSKSVVDNDQLSGLGIQDTLPQAATDVSFTHAARRGSAHHRTISSGSQGSNSSASQLRSNQPFVHPMRQTPRPYTPPVPSNASSVDEEEANETDDVLLDDELRLPPGFRNKRSMSLSSQAQNAPTPLSQSYTAADLFAAETLTTMPTLSSRSQSNLSTGSNPSSRSSSNLRPGRPRRDTDRSIDAPTLPSSRTSLDKAVSFVSRTGKADPEPATREDRIRAARRKFDEKEAEKDRKMHQKRERQRRKSEASDHKPAPRLNEKPPKMPQLRPDEKHQLHAVSYEATPPTDLAALPQHGAEAGTSEKPAKARTMRSQQKKNAQGNWLRFSTWVSTRMMNCGHARRSASSAA